MTNPTTKEDDMTNPDTFYAVTADTAYGPTDYGTATDLAERLNHLANLAKYGPSGVSRDGEGDMDVLVVPCDLGTFGPPVKSADDCRADLATAYATREGTAAGHGAAGWYIQDSIGGRVTGDVTDTARRILRGLDDGDPEVLDTFPHADLSGEWAETLTGPELVADALSAAGIDEPDSDDYPDTAGPDTAEQVTYDDAVAAYGDTAANLFGDICEAYENAYADAAADEIARASRSVLRAVEVDDPEQ